ncbi:MAG: PsbP-related protein [Candidatus Nitrosopolaris sp.]
MHRIMVSNTQGQSVTQGESNTMKKLVALGIFILILVLITPNANLYGRYLPLTPAERYNSGFLHGGQKAAIDFNTRSPFDSACVNHTGYYCAGWVKGYTARWSNLVQNNETQPGLTPAERYNSGFSQGGQKAAIDFQNHSPFNPACDRTKHTSYYCSGWVKGYTAKWNDEIAPAPTTPTPNPGNETPGQTQPTTPTPNPGNETPGHTQPTTPTPNPGNETKTLTTYENSTYGIKMQYPSDWQSVEGASNSPVSFYPQRDNASNIAVQIENLTTSFTPDQYLNFKMQRDAADYKDFPEIRFTHNTTNNIVLSGHPGFLFNGTFRYPTSGVLDGFSYVGTAYSIQYYSPAQTYPDYSTTYSQMIGSFEVIPPPPNQQGNQTQPPPMPAPNPNPPITNPNPSTSTNPSTDWLLLVIFLIIIAAVWKLKHRGRKYKERHDFSESVKEKILEKQHHRCANCKTLLNVVDYHHRNGDRSDNKQSNCEALCPNCHADKTRRSAV